MRNGVWPRNLDCAIDVWVTTILEMNVEEVKAATSGVCKENHHYLLHREKSALPRTETKEEGSKDEDKKKDNGSGVNTEGD